MKLSCRLELLPGKTVLEQAEAGHQYGFDGVGLPGRFLDRYLGDLEASLSDLPIPPMSLSLGFASSLLHPRTRERTRCRDSLLGLMDICARLGVGLINVPPVLIQDNPVRIGDPGEFPSLAARLDALLIDQLNEIGDEAAARGLCFLLEPVNRFESEYLHSIEQGARLCERINHPAVGMTIDAFHMQMEERWPGESIRNAGGHVRHVHIAENTREEPGVGALDLKSVFRGLQAIDYDAWIEVEARTLSGPPETVLPRSVAYVRGCWKENPVR